MDIVLSLALIIITAPLLLLLWCLVRSTSAGPALFRQKRLGRDVQPFTLLKLRTMYVGNDDRIHRDYVTSLLSADRAAAAGGSGLFKLDADPRITPLGAWLRRTSLDELPQLVNVLRGEMSLVGPRPHARAHDEFYARKIAHYTLRQYVKPGITGWAQVNGHRGETPTIEAMRARVDHDVWYVAHADIALDLKILFRTAFEVLRRRNAY